MPIYCQMDRAFKVTIFYFTFFLFTLTYPISLSPSVSRSLSLFELLPTPTLPQLNWANSISCNQNKPPRERLSMFSSFQFVYIFISLRCTKDFRSYQQMEVETRLKRCVALQGRHSDSRTQTDRQTDRRGVVRTVEAACVCFCASVYWHVCVFV